MYVDVVLMKKSKDVEVLANKLGFEKLLFEEDFKKLKTLKKHLNKFEIVVLKEISEIKRKDNPVWGIG